MTPLLAAVATAATLHMSRTGSRRRLQLPKSRVSRRSRRGLFAALAPAAVGTFLLGPVGVAATAVVVAVLVVRRRKRTAEPPASADLALALDVLAGCLSAGAAMPAALAAAQSAAPSRVADAFAAAAAALRRGDDPGTTWARVGAVVPELVGVGQLCARAAVTGAAVAGELHRLAAAHRTSLDTARRRRLQRASVWLVLPLGLCFLPAFVLVGVVPLVLGAIPGVMHGR